MGQPIEIDLELINKVKKMAETEVKIPQTFIIFLIFIMNVPCEPIGIILVHQ
jgi:hypothetical protein